MEKHFATYTQSLALKELGFDEPCMGKYDTKQGDEWLLNIYSGHLNIQFSDKSKACIAPLKSQVFEWFRKNHLLGHEINCPFISYSGKLACIKNEGRYELYITDEEQLSLPEDIFYSTDYFEAESKAIDKLIEIIKNK